MGWRRGRFNDQQVWVEVDEAGRPQVQSGRVAMRYQPHAGARIYRGGASRVTVEDDAPIQSLEDGVAADAQPRKAPASRGSGFGKAGTRSRAQAAAAAAAAEEALEALLPGTVVVFTDGGCKGNPGPAGSGAWVALPDGRHIEASRSLGRATNNVAELDAIALALELLDEAEVPPHAPVALFTDSSYAHGVLCKGWKAKANAERIAELRARLARRPGVKVQWVAGHAGIAGNERADALANEAVAGRTETRWT